MDQKLNLDVTSKDGVCTILTGKALEEKAPEKILISGILSAPAQFLERKGQLFNAVNCHLIVDKLSGKLRFQANDKDHYGDQVNGSLNKSEILSKFKINGDHLYSANELESLFRKSKVWFASKEECNEMIFSLKNFNATVIKKVELANDDKGNTKNLFETAVSGVTLKSTFKLKLPIFEGYDKLEILVEVGIDVTSANLRFFLLSDDLYELYETEKEKLLKEQIAKFEDFGCAVVHIS